MLKALHHIGYLNDESYLELPAGLFYARYDSDDAVGRLSMTNGQLKHEHWGLIYAGGLLVAIAQDLQIQSATDNEQSVDDLMRFLFDELDGTTYGLADIERALGDLNDGIQKEFFDRYVHGVEEIPVSQFLAIAGIDTVEEGGRTTVFIDLARELCKVAAQIAPPPCLAHIVSIDVGYFTPNSTVLRAEASSTVTSNR